jgi:hypothetical protein
MEMNKSQIDWSKIFQGSLEQLQSAPPEILDVDLEHIVHELLKPDAPGVHCVPESILDANNIVGNASRGATATATMGATAAGLQVLPEFQATKLGDVVNQGLEYAPTWTVSECLDNWAKAQRQGTANDVVHRSVVLHPVPVPPTNAFGSCGTFTTQAIAVNSSEMVRKQAAKVARAARVQKRRQEKFRKGDSKLAQPAEVLIQSFSGHLPIQPTQLVAQISQPKTDAKDRNEIRAIKNRESAARSRAKRVEYTAALEAQVEKLREQNKTLRGRVIALAPAPPDPHAGKLEGRPLRRTRTMPL